MIRQKGDTRQVVSDWFPPNWDKLHVVQKLMSEVNTTLRVRGKWTKNRSFDIVNPLHSCTIKIKPLYFFSKLLPSLIWKKKKQ